MSLLVFYRMYRQYKVPLYNVLISEDIMEVSFSPRDTAYTGTYVTWTMCLYSIVEAMIMPLATENTISTGYFACSDVSSKHTVGHCIV
jgi:hypothetical protein